MHYNPDISFFYEFIKVYKFTYFTKNSLHYKKRSIFVAGKIKLFTYHE